MYNRFFRINRRIDLNLLGQFLSFLRKIKGMTDYVYMVFDTNGGELIAATRMINAMQESGLKFVGIAYREVHSAAIPIFLSCHIRFGYKEAIALLHRAKSEDEDLSPADLFWAERQIFEIFAQKLKIKLKKVYEIADQNTLINMEHPLGKNFFISNNQIPAFV